MTDPDSTIVLRNPARKFAHLFWLLFIALSVFVTISRSGAHKLEGALGVLLFGAFFVLSLRAGVRCDREGVVALDEMGRHRFSWADIDHFEQRGLRGIGVVRPSGRWVRLTAWATLGDVSPEKATSMLEAQRLKFQDRASLIDEG